MRTTKTADFFIEKADNYIADINYYLQNDSLIDFLDRRLLEADKKNEFNNCLSEIKELKLKIRLFFSEFENGNLFTNNLMNDPKDAQGLLSISEKDILKSYKRTLELFIEHLKEFIL